MKTFTKYLIVLTVESVAMTVLTKAVMSQFVQIEEVQDTILDLQYQLESRVDSIERSLDEIEDFDFDDEVIVVDRRAGLGYPTVLNYDSDPRPAPRWVGEDSIL